MPHSVAVPRCLSALQEVMVHLCSGEQAVVSKQAVQAGCHALLNTMGTEDVIGDAPKAADWVRLGLPVMLLCIHRVGHCCCNWTRTNAAAWDSAVYCSLSNICGFLLSGPAFGTSHQRRQGFLHHQPRRLTIVS